jgi:hypothetical protein
LSSESNSASASTTPIELTVWAVSSSGRRLAHVLALLSESGLPVTYLDAVLSDDELRHKLLSATKDAELRAYFSRHFAAEGKQTIAALRARMESLFAAESVRLALAGSRAPDFRRLQNEGCIVLINCAGPTITRGVRNERRLKRWMLKPRKRRRKPVAKPAVLWWAPAVGDSIIFSSLAPSPLM